MEITRRIEIELKESLKESCNLIYDFANNHCKNGDGDDNCVWYHSIWQYYRMLNVVANPTWHNEFFDVICTDAFLTRFSDNDSNLVIDKWYKLLKKEGKIITTVRIHDSDTKNTPNAMEKYIQKIKKEYNKYEKYIGISCDKLMEKTEEWLNKKKSNNIGDKEKILNKFKKFDVEYNVRKVSGELSETEYIELVATKN